MRPERPSTTSISAPTPGPSLPPLETRTLDYWDVPGRKHLRRLVGVSRTFAGESGELYGGRVAFLPDGELAVLTASQGVSFLGPSGRRSARSSIERGNAKAVKVAVDRQGRSLAVGWHDGRIDVLDARTSALRRSFVRNPRNFAFSPDGQWLAVDDQIDSIELLPTSEQAAPFTLRRGRGALPVLALSPDGVTLASAADRSLVLWDLTSKEELLRLGGHKEAITAVAFSPDGALVATTCGDHSTRIWDARDGRALAVLPGPWFMRALAFSPDGGYLAAAADPGPICLYQLKAVARAAAVWSATKFGRPVRLAVHPRLPRFASGSRRCGGHRLGRGRGFVRCVNGTPTAESGCGAWPTAPTARCWRSAHGNSGGYDFPNDHSIHLWDAENGKLRKPRLPRLPNFVGVRALAFDPTGRRLASGDAGAGRSSSGTWTPARACVARIWGGAFVRSAVFVNGGRHLIVGQT